MGGQPPKGITLGVYTVLGVFSTPHGSHLLLKDSHGKIGNLPIEAEDGNYFAADDAGEISFTKP